MRATLTNLFLLILITCTAQYSNPYRVAFDGTSYLITNQGNGTVTKLTGGSPSTVISGLGLPTDIFFGTFGTNSAVLVIDSNKLKLFNPTTYASLININITGAVFAHDGVVNPNNSNEFFITDRNDNKIIKGTVGPAPFYPVSFTTFATGISKPTGMIVNDNGDLIVVSDTINANIYEVDPTTGAVSVAATSTIDYMDDIAQDNQGNYYLTNWGDDKLYRYDDNLSNKTALTTHNKPAGLYSNRPSDFLVMACSGCGTVEFKNYHLFAPNSDIFTCQTDSFFVDVSPLYNGIGTYGSANKFEVEMSDASGNFNSATVIASVTATTPPASIKTILPAGTYASFGHRYRIVSTSPPITSFLDKQLNVFASENAEIASVDTLVLCSGSSTVLGNTSMAGNTYVWTTTGMLSDTSIAQPTFTAASTGFYPIKLEISTTQGCYSADSAVIQVAPNLSIPSLQDSMRMCIGDTIQIGADAVPYQFSWVGSSELDNSSLSNPSFFGQADTKMYVNFSDSAGSCFGDDSVYVSIDTLPTIPIMTGDNIVVCRGDTLTLTGYDANYKFDFTVGLPFYSSTALEAKYDAVADGSYSMTAVVSDFTSGCSDSYSNGVVVASKPDSIIIDYDHSVYGIKANVYGGSGLIRWKINGNFVSGGSDTLSRSRLSEGDLVEASMEEAPGCLVTSNEINWSTASVNDAFVSFSVYPNPSTNHISIQSSNVVRKAEVFSSTGALLLSTKDTQIDISNLESGTYIIGIETDKGLGKKRFIKL